MGKLDIDTGDIDFPFEDIDNIGDENKKRGNWSSNLDFILSCLGFSVGLGNLWRFPYYCYSNGGGAFLIPYFIMLVIGGIPIFFMELALGQFASLGCVSVWKICPLFKGVGVSMFIVACMISVYYNIITAWSIFYVVSSFRSQVPWSSCGNPWNTPNCYVWNKTAYDNCTSNGGTLLRKGECSFLNVSMEFNSSDLIPLNRTLPSDEYFHNHVLSISSGIDDIGHISWQLALSLFLAWIIIFFCLFKGIKTSGKVVYVTTTAPYIILLVLLVRALTLEGSVDGLLYFITPRWSSLADPKVWGDAAVQVFFSLSSCCGGLITLSSYNRFHNNVYRDMWIIALGDAFTSIFAGMVVFATLGVLSFEVNKDITLVAKQGAGLAFVVYAEAIGRLPVAPVWAIIFFLMLIMLGIDTQFFIMETIVTAICDEYPERLRKNHRHVLALAVVIFYILGVPLCTQAGMYILQLLDYFAATWSLLIIGFFECLAVAWVYGVDNLLDNIKWMIGRYPKPYAYWKISWKFFTPLIVMAILLFTFLYYTPLKYNEYVYPEWANTAGWGVSFVSVISIPIVALIKLCQAKGPYVERLRDLLSPEDDWGPAMAIHRAEIFPVDTCEGRLPVKYPTGALDTDGLDNENLGLMEEPKFEKETAI